jgi:hypothetical protein
MSEPQTRRGEISSPQPQPLPKRTPTTIRYPAAKNDGAWQPTPAELAAMANALRSL